MTGSPYGTGMVPLPPGGDDEGGFGTPSQRNFLAYLSAAFGPPKGWGRPQGWGQQARYSESTAGMDGAAPAEGEPQRGGRRKRQRPMGDDVPSFGGAVAGVSPIQWGDTTPDIGGADSGGSGNFLSMLMRRYGGGGQ